MDSKKLNDWLMLFANVGVVVGLGLLIVELRQNSEMMQAQITQSRADAAMMLAIEFADSDYVPAIIDKLHHDQELTFEEQARFERWLRASLRNQENNYLQYLRGYLGDYISEAGGSAIRNTLRYELAKDYWIRAKPDYSAEFVEFVDKALSSSSD